MRSWLFRDINFPLLVAAVALIIWAVYAGDPYNLRLLTTAGVFATAVLGYQFIFGYAGELSLAQGTFFGLGAYTTGIIGSQLGWGFETTLPLSIVLPVLLASLVAIPVIRLESHYFALATLGIGQVVLLTAINWESLTGGANGIPAVPGVRIFDFEIARGWPLLALVWGIAILAGTASWIIKRGIRGHAYALMRSDPLAAQAIGIDIHQLRLQAFLFSAVLGGIAGSLHVHTNRVVSPDVLEFHIMVTILVMTVLGGRTHISGAFIGAVLVSHLAEWFRFLEQYYLLAYGLLLLLMVIAAPWGIAGTLERLRKKFLPEHMPPTPKPQQIINAPVPSTGLEVQGLTKYFGGIQALDSVCMNVHPGEVLGLIGANGCGKTTLINIVTGLETADCGEIRWAGRPIIKESSHALVRLGITRTFQSTRLLEDYSALDNVVVGSWKDKKVDSTSIANAHAISLLGKLDVADTALIPARLLSLGVRRRLEIARALATRPSLIFLDEPAAGLTINERKVLTTTIKQLSRDGVTLVVVDHNLEFLSEIADRMVCLNHGRVIASGSVDAVQNHPEVILSYLGGSSTSEREIDPYG